MSEPRIRWHDEAKNSMATFTGCIGTLDGAVIITACEDFDQYTAPEFRDLVSALLSGEGQNLIADLTATTHIDSVGVGVLVGTRRRMDERGGRFCAVVADEHVMATLGRMGLLDVLRVRGSLGEALGALGAVA